MDLCRQQTLLSPSTDMADLPTLHTYYYHDNFRHLLHQVERLYGDILNTSERDFIQDFYGLSESAQRIYIRMLMRKGDLFRCDKLRYDEITDIDAALQELQQQRFLIRIDPADGHVIDREDEQAGAEAAALLSLFNKSELAQWAASIATDRRLSSLKALPRSELEHHCLTLLQQSPDSLTDLLSVGVVCVCGELEFTTLRLLYFGNLYQDFTDFVLRDLGIYRYENYSLDNDSRGFNSRAQLQEHLSYYLKVEQGEVLSDADEPSLVKMADDWLQFSQTCEDERLRRRAQQRCCECARQLERLKSDDLALRFYQSLMVHPARERRCRLLLKRGMAPEVWALCQQILERPLHAIERQFALVFLPRLGRLLQRQSEAEKAHWCLTQTVTDKPLVTSECHLDFAGVWEQQGVESAAAQWLVSERGGQALHVENAFFLSVFGLFYWPVIFAPIPGAFYHEFHSAPVDLYQPDFLQKRQDIYAGLQRFFQPSGECQAERFTPEMMASFTREVSARIGSKAGIANPFVHWGFIETLGVALFEQLLRAVPLSHWQRIFDYLWQDVKNHRNGLPDLFWLSDDQQYELIEVKGPGDSLQKNQLAWLDYFASQDIPASVLYVKKSAQ